MPEGDTLHRTATVLRQALVGREVTAASGGVGRVALGRVVGSHVERVEAHGKHLLVSFSDGRTLHTHLRMHGSWHRYRPGERWRRPTDRAVAVVEVPGAVAVCFDAPTVEFIDSRALRLHPALAALGPPDLATDSADLEDAFLRLRHASRAAVPIGDALLDQRAAAGLGNVYRSEVCHIERVDPFAVVGSLDDATLRRLLATGARLLRANLEGPSRTTTPDPSGAPASSSGRRPPGRRLWVYGRAGRPCRRCGALIRTSVSGQLRRPVYWCSTCQPRASAQ